MSSYLNKKWNWDISTVKGGSAEADVNVFIWEYDSNTSTNLLSDSNGVISTVVTEATYTIDNTDDVTEAKKTPHTLSICKYGLKVKDLLIGFVSSRVDTFYMEDDIYITESDKATVSGYTGIDIDHSNQVITLTENHTIEEFYDYTQYDLTQNPQKSYPKGVFYTNDGVNFTLKYDIIIDGCSFTGSGRFIDMSDNEKTLQNDGSTNIKIKDINGLPMIFSCNVVPAITDFEYRIYEVDNLGSLAGATELQGVESSNSSNIVYNYTYTEDKNIAVQIIAQPNNDYEESVTYYVLSDIDQNINIQLQTDINN